MLRLRFPHWFDQSRRHLLSLNPNAIRLLEENPKWIDWELLCLNPNAIHLIENTLNPHLIENTTGIDWYALSSNPNAMGLLEKHLDKVDWCSLSGNPGAIRLLSDHPDKIQWRALSGNPAALSLLEENPDKIHWCVLRHLYFLHGDPNIPRLFEKNGLRVLETSIVSAAFSTNVETILENVDHLTWSDWYYLCARPDMIPILQENQDKIHWHVLCSNPNAMSILEKNLDKITWREFSSNPSIFAYDYDAMKENTSLYKEELIQMCLHPKRFAKYLYEYNYDLGTDDPFNL